MPNKVIIFANMAQEENGTFWFESWFDSPYYHLLYSHRDHEEAKGFIDNLSVYLNISPEDKILDMGCGRGRHAIYLNKKGYRVTGIDLSPRNIEFARHFENEKLKFQIWDMRDQLKDENFDIILNLFTSFGYFDEDAENKKVIESASTSLKRGGRFVLDFLNALKIKDLSVEEVQKKKGIDFYIKKENQNNFIIKTIKFRDKNKEYYFTEQVKAYTVDELNEIFNSSGFEVIDIFGDYNLNSFDPALSERVILVGKKKVN